LADFKLASDCLYSNAIVYLVPQKKTTERKPLKNVVFDDKVKVSLVDKYIKYMSDTSSINSSDIESPKSDSDYNDTSDIEMQKARKPKIDSKLVLNN